MTHDWYVACRFTSTRRVDGEDVLWPASLAHAKRMGTNVTACGRSSSTWVKLFQVGFPAAGIENCLECQNVVSFRTRSEHGARESG